MRNNKGIKKDLSKNNKNQEMKRTRRHGNKHKEKIQMDSDIPRTSSYAPLTGGKFPLAELGIGTFTPSKAWKVANLNSLSFNKYLGKIFQESIKRLCVSIVAPLSTTIEIVVVENIKDDPLATTSTSVSFTRVSKKNLKNMIRRLKSIKKELGPWKKRQNYTRVTEPTSRILG